MSSNYYYVTATVEQQRELGKFARKHKFTTGPMTYTYPTLYVDLQRSYIEDGYPTPTSPYTTLEKIRKLIEKNVSSILPNSGFRLVKTKKFLRIGCTSFRLSDIEKIREKLNPPTLFVNGYEVTVNKKGVRYGDCLITMKDIKHAIKFLDNGDE